MNARTSFARTLSAALLLALLGAFGCKETAPTEADAGGPQLPAPPEVGDEKGPFVLRYFSPTSGNLLVAKTPADVPEAARGQVLVVPDDPALRGPWIFVADLTSKAGEHYAVQVVDRYALEAEVRAEQLKKAPPAGMPGSAKADVGGGPQVILYKTAWCGYCKKAAEYLKLKGVPYVAKDIERDAGARNDMLQRAQQAGFPTSQLGGVPVLWIKGKVLTGFSREAIDRALGG
ncbi:MAG: hypothetical protein H6747_10235 [Deltaproteobacteria bacterium]|nr:hypothetical protein [Deltaproteobacteria bacterium]